MQKVADMGSAVVASNLGFQYTVGEGVPQSLKNAEY